MLEILRSRTTEAGFIANRCKFESSTHSCSTDKLCLQPIAKIWYSQGSSKGRGKGAACSFPGVHLPPLSAWLLLFCDLFRYNSGTIEACTNQTLPTTIGRRWGILGAVRNVWASEQISFFPHLVVNLPPLSMWCLRFGMNSPSDEAIYRIHVCCPLCREAGETFPGALTLTAKSTDSV